MVVCVSTADELELITRAPGAVVTPGGGAVIGGTVMAFPAELRIVWASVMAPPPEVDRLIGGLPDDGGGGGGGGGGGARTRFWLRMGARCS